MSKYVKCFSLLYNHVQYFVRTPGDLLWFSKLRREDSVQDIAAEITYQSHLDEKLRFVSHF